MNPNELLEAARLARERAYAPYSRFRVGAAVVTHDGRVFHGCNVENASYGLTTCAERTALLAAIAAGVKPGEFAQLAVIADATQPIAPCGACRQVMLELGGSQLPVLLANLHGLERATTVGALLPEPYTPDLRRG
jgi:cytidine deaminase